MKLSDMEIAQKLDKSLGRFFKTMMMARRQGELRPIENAAVTCLYHSTEAGKKEISPSALSSEMGAHHPAVTPVLNRLEEMGYLTRRHSSSDRRVVYVSLTEKGVEFARTHMQFRTQENLKLVEFLGEEESTQLIETLDKISSYYKSLNSSGGTQN